MERCSIGDYSPILQRPLDIGKGGQRKAKGYMLCLVIRGKVKSWNSMLAEASHRGGITEQEDLPTPEKSISQVERATKAIE